MPVRWLRILLVEDDAVISALVAELLVDLEHGVCATVRTEAEAVEAAMRLAPDLMIVDVHLRVGSGVSAMEAILRRTAMPHIFMTGGARALIPARAIVLHKPFDTASLVAALDRVAAGAAASAPAPVPPGGARSDARPDVAAAAALGTGPAGQDSPTAPRDGPSATGGR